MIIVKNPDGTYTLTPTLAEAAVLDRALVKFGPDVLRDLVANWLADRAKVFREEDAGLIMPKYEALTQVQKDQVDAILGIQK